MNLFVEINTIRDYILMPGAGGIKIFIITSAYGLELSYSLRVALIIAFELQVEDF